MKPAEQAVFSSLAHQMVNNRLTQKYKYNYTYQVNSLVNAGGSAPKLLSIEQDADFLFEKMTGSCFGPVDENGIPQQANTDFPMPGIAIGQGFAGRGLSCQITDTGNGRELTNGNIPLETILTPGYGTQLYTPYPIKYFAARNSKIKFVFTNQDTQARQSVTVVINGYKFEMPEQKAELEVNKKMANASNVAQ
jgi:hypothetical protein